MTVSPALEDVLSELREAGTDAHREKMAHYGIDTKKAFGVTVPKIRKIARKHGTSHELAGSLWSSGWHEARLLAGLIDDPATVSREQMNSWVRDFDSWDVCDLTCSNLFDRTDHAVDTAMEWVKKDSEFVKRAGFVLMATLSVHDKTAPDTLFLSFLESIERECEDDRNFVKKATSWALRQIGKRNSRLHKAAVETARRIAARPEPGARWAAKDCLRELTGEAVAARFRKKQQQAHGH